MKKIMGIIALSTFCFVACNNQAKEEKKMTEQEVKKDTLSEHTIDPSLLVNKKDPICGMPTAAGMSDTATYKGKVFGFCAKECKDEFEKNPEQYIAAAELKMK